MEGGKGKGKRKGKEKGKGKGKGKNLKVKVKKGKRKAHVAEITNYIGSSKIITRTISIFDGPIPLPPPKR